MTDQQCLENDHLINSTNSYIEEDQSGLIYIGSKKKESETYNGSTQQMEDQCWEKEKLYEIRGCQTKWEEGEVVETTNYENQNTDKVRSGHLSCMTMSVVSTAMVTWLDWHELLTWQSQARNCQPNIWTIKYFHRKIPPMLNLSLFTLTVRQSFAARRRQDCSYLFYGECIIDVP